MVIFWLLFRECFDEVDFAKETELFLSDTSGDFGASLSSTLEWSALGGGDILRSFPVPSVALGSDGAATVSRSSVRLCTEPSLRVFDVAGTVLEPGWSLILVVLRFDDELARRGIDEFFTGIFDFETV